MEIPFFLRKPLPPVIGAGVGIASPYSTVCIPVGCKDVEDGPDCVMGRLRIDFEKSRIPSVLGALTVRQTGGLGIGANVNTAEYLAL